MFTPDSLNPKDWHIYLMSIESEVQDHRKTIQTDSYTMSIGEIANMYRDREIIIRPEFQRLFRWPIEKQSRLIESILLGLPIPSIFVSQQPDGTWELIDGLQRISTILKFMGELRNDSNGEFVPAEPLTRTKYLPSLEGIEWNSSLANALKIDFKRSRIEVQILQRDSDKDAKYEMFDRLNSGGAVTSPQEIRSAILQMEDVGFFRWIDSLRNSDEFSSCMALTERQQNEQYDLELVIRHIVLHHSNTSKLKIYPDMEALLTDGALSFAADEGFNRDQAGTEFKSVFRILGSVGPDVFRKFDDRRGKPIGAFSVSAYEAITQGVHSHLREWLKVGPSFWSEELLKRVQTLWKYEYFTKNSGGGVRATQRIPHMKEAGRTVFSLQAS